MLKSINSLMGNDVRGTDGEVGEVADFLFDDITWTVQYLVVNTGGWLTGKKVLLSPRVIDRSIAKDSVLSIGLSREETEQSAAIDSDAPVSRQKQMELTQCYGWPVYWHGLGAAGVVPAASAGAEAATDSEADPHLRSSSEVKGYTLEAKDGEIGNVYDFIVEQQTWTIQKIAVDTGGWLPGRKVLLSHAWAEEVRWAEGTLTVNMTKDQVQSAPDYDPDSPIFTGPLYDFVGEAVDAG